MNLGNRHTPRRRGAPIRRRNLGLAIGAIALSLVLCTSATISGILWVVRAFTDRGDDIVQQVPAWAVDSAELTVAVSPVMAPVLQELAGRFNSLDYRTPDGKKMAVRLVTEVPEKMVQQALDFPPFQAMSPDSSLWLEQLEAEWARRYGDQNEDTTIPIGQRRISEQMRYAVSPVVIAAWESVARELGWPERPIGWQDIQRKATEDPNFKWNHPSTNNASGLLATLAEFYAGAGLTRGLTEEAATAEETLAYVQAVEATVRFYGEGEEVIVQRLAQEGRSFLDAFVGQEQVVIDWNRRQQGERLVAIYPAEGTLWTDHPLALLELGNKPHELSVTENQRLTFQAFAQFLRSQESQLALLAAGYRPADLSIPLDGPGSPFANTDAVDWRQPQTTLQMPPPSVVNVVRNVWYYTKRPTNVYLVVDTSGSMEGTKIARTREALAAFVQQIQGDRDRVGLIEFGTSTKNFIPLRVMDERNRRDLLQVIEQMEAFGGTALIDAVYDAVADLQAQGDESAINAVVVMTDGQENESYRRLADIEELLRRSGSRPPVIFTIAFGQDADERLLQELARIGQGQFRRADETDIQELYRIISTYF
ncbi:VWA domain-containing protein [Litorilinea aerophila]|uniref:VWA domain-containing protein n=1 Tax=Litorilinea aerophila TaxID=1204385 RepID=A0A540VKX3_9CHLR|nr:VWA domain-containing protein [Litorilinea aerophila]MCC9075060.1 VWA domain-containing protein [Litorilinea aerophila]